MNLLRKLLNLLITIDLVKSMCTDDIPVNQKDASEGISVEDSLLHGGILKFTYGDSDPQGPKNWKSLKANPAKCEFNCCGTEQNSPVNIILSKTTFAESAATLEKLSDDEHPTLEFFIDEGIEQKKWTLGYPEDTWHGLEIRPAQSASGYFQLFDQYHLQIGNEGQSEAEFDFKFAQITYCDIENKHIDKKRSSHQIDGERFPLEIHLLFFFKPLQEVCFRQSLRGRNNNSYVMVSILGKLDDTDNPVLEPMIKAASTFQGADDFENSEEKLHHYTVPIVEPFAPSWFISNGSEYIYYENGTFVVPPCFPIPRVYVLKEPITISKRQLKVLTTMKSKREPSGKLECTFGTIQNKIKSEDIHYNGFTISINGNDSRPNTENTGKILVSYWSIICFQIVLLLLLT